MDKHISETISMIELNSKLSLYAAERLLSGSVDNFSRHQAAEIKAKCEDNLRLTSALTELIKNHES